MRTAALTLATIAAVLFSGGAAFAESAEHLVGKHTVSTYDRFSDYTTIRTPHLRLCSDSSGVVETPLEFTCVISCSGDSTCTGAVVSLNFYCQGKNWRFSESYERALMFIGNGKRFRLHASTYQPTVVDGHVAEFMGLAMLKEEAIELLSNAVEGRLGNTEFYLRTPKTAPAIDEFVELLRRAK